jgi:hypothetical protein
MSRSDLLWKGVHECAKEVRLLPFLVRRRRIGTNLLRVSSMEGRPSEQPKSISALAWT